MRFSLTLLISTFLFQGVAFAVCGPKDVETLEALGRLSEGADLNIPDARARAIALLPPRVLTEIFSEERDIALNKLVSEIQSQAPELAPLGYQWSFVGEFLDFPNSLVGEAVAGLTTLNNGQMKIFSGLVKTVGPAIKMQTVKGELEMPLGSIGGLHVLVPLLPKNKMGTPELDALPAGRYKRFSQNATHPDVIKFLTEVNDPASGWQAVELKPGVFLHIGQVIAYIYVDPSNPTNGQLVSGRVKRFSNKLVGSAIIETRFGEWPLHFISGQKVYLQRPTQ